MATSTGVNSDNYVVDYIAIVSSDKLLLSIESPQKSDDDKDDDTDDIAPQASTSSGAIDLCSGLRHLLIVQYHSNQML